MRAAAQQIDQTKREERQRAGTRMRVGFQVVVLALVVTLAFILVFPTARLYSTQQEEKARLAAAVEVATVRADDLQAELDRWEDPAFIKAQARQRLSYIMPGERSYRVNDPENAPELPTVTPPPPIPDPAELGPQDQAPPPWYSQLWDSTLEAGRQ